MSSNLAASVGSLRIKDPDGFSAYDSSESLSDIGESNNPTNKVRDSVDRNKKINSDSIEISTSNSSLDNRGSDTKESTHHQPDSTHTSTVDQANDTYGQQPGHEYRGTEDANNDELDRFTSDSGSSHNRSIMSRLSSRSTNINHLEQNDTHHTELNGHGIDGSNHKSLDSNSLHSQFNDSRESLIRSRENTPQAHVAAVQQSRVRSTGSPGMPNGRNFSENSLGSKVLEENEKISPLDDIDRLLPGSKSGGTNNNSNNNNNSSHNQIKQASRANRFRSPLRMGMLSFEGRQNAGSSQLDDELEDDKFLQANDALEDGTVGGGVRRKQMVTRRLETENMELRLKLQQYREINASEQEMSRVKYQLARSERRIDELEEALERKNQTIRDLVAERDTSLQAAQTEQTNELYQIIEELQQAITKLEQETADTESHVTAALSQAHTDFPDVVPANAKVSDLVDALREILEDNDKLKSLAASASSLRSQQASLRDLLTKMGHPGDPYTSVREIGNELEQTIKDASTIRESLGRENWKLSHELESLREAFYLKNKEVSEYNNKLKTLTEKDNIAMKDMEAKLEDMEQILTESRSTNYLIVRRFFAELFEVLGADFQDTVEQQLEDIMTRAREEGLSKIPLLTDLLVSHARKLAEIAAKYSSQPKNDHRIWVLEREVQSLEHIVHLKWDKAGADAVLSAQVRDLKKQLKLEQEKRKSEWAEYQRSLEKIRNGNP